MVLGLFWKIRDSFLFGESDIKHNNEACRILAGRGCICFLSLACKTSCLKWSWSSEVLVGWLNKWIEENGVKRGEVNGGQGPQEGKREGEGESKRKQKDTRGRGRHRLHAPVHSADTLGAPAMCQPQWWAWG